MKTLEHYKKIFEELTTGSRRRYDLPNGITLDAVKVVMKESGYFRQTLDQIGIMEDIRADIENGYIKRRDFSSWYALKSGFTEFYSLTAKGTKKLYNYLTTKN